MADTAPAPAAAAPEKKGGSKLIIIIIVAAVVLLGGGGGAAFYFLRKPAAAVGKDGKPIAAKAEKKEVGGGVVSFEPFIVNLADANGARFLRINVRLIVAEQEQAEKIQKNEVLLVRLRSAILELLTQQTSDKLVTAEGKTELKKTIAEHAAEILEPAKVSDVLFSDFVVQL